jgi:TonB family protein
MSTIAKKNTAAEPAPPVRPPREKPIQASLVISLVVHTLFFLGVVFMNQSMQHTPLLQLREIDIVEPEEIQPEAEPTPEPEKKSMFNFLKEVIPVKQRPRRVVHQPVPQPRPAPKPREPMSFGPLIAKKAIMNESSVAGSVAPLISKSSIGTGPSAGAPKWEKGPGGRMGGGGNLNIGLSTILPEAKDKGVADADLAASLQGKRGGLSLHTSTDVNGIVANVGQGKSLNLSSGRSGNGANLGGFRDASMLFGQIKNRKILRSRMPKYPAWAEEQGIEASTSIRVGVLADGTVDETSVYVESTSGYPELDNLAVAAAKMFIFAPLAGNKSQVIQYGGIRFVFQLKH